MDEVGADGAYESDLSEIRERIIQLKRETDAKAPADHDHERLSARLDRLEGELESVRGELGEVREAAETIDDRINGGFENYHDLLDRTETIERRLDTLGETVLSAREQEQRRDRLASLVRTANREGVRTAACGECEETVDLGLLADPECPHCETTFGELDAGHGLFGSAALRTDE